jgi:5-methylcytosine-specific restriction endonuclease McrA
VFRIAAGLCEACYTHHRRTGEQRDPTPKPYKVFRRGDGYLVVQAPAHPLGDRKKRVAVHRMVAFDVRNGECGACHWCDLPLTWRKAHVDHLNEVKDDNRPENLVVSCKDCNQARGQALMLIRRATPIRALEILALLQAETRDEQRRGVV